MRHIIIGTIMLLAGLVVTFAAASLLQGMAVANRTETDDSFTIDKIRPDPDVNRGPRNEPGGRSVNLANRRAAGS
jgi:hypothetical protein